MYKPLYDQNTVDKLFTSGYVVSNSDLSLRSRFTMNMVYNFVFFLFLCTWWDVYTQPQDIFFSHLYSFIGHLLDFFRDYVVNVYIMFVFGVLDFFIVFIHGLMVNALTIEIATSLLNFFVSIFTTISSLFTGLLLTFILYLPHTLYDLFSSYMTSLPVDFTFYIPIFYFIYLWFCAHLLKGLYAIYADYGGLLVFGDIEIAKSKFFIGIVTFFVLYFLLFI